MQAQIVSKIRKLRRDKGLTQLQMADLLHIEQSAYARLEQGETNTWAKYFEDLLRIFEISPEKFFEGIESKVVINNHNDCTYSGNSNVEHQHLENQDIYERLIEQYEKLLATKDEQIEFMKNMLEKK
ncbi:MAG: helix-turn-helix domain-containing protein [Paludibacter sp.]|nr:helix-turn-helix domain-containing protein [Paludibacter sp.]